MTPELHLLILCALSVFCGSSQAVAPGPGWLIPDQVIFADDFSQPRGEITLDRRNTPDAPWQPNQGTRWEVIDGVLRGRASSSDFQASRSHHKGVHPRIVLSKTPEAKVLRSSMHLLDGIPFEACKPRSVMPFIEIGHHVCRGTLVLNGGPVEAFVGNVFRREPFHGLIDEFAFYNFALTDEEVRSHFDHAARGENYFGATGNELRSSRWKATARIVEGETQRFDQWTGLPIAKLSRNSPPCDKVITVFTQPRGHNNRLIFDRRNHR